MNIMNVAVFTILNPIYILSGINFTDTNVNYYMFAGLTVLAIAGVLTFILIVPVKRLVCVYVLLTLIHSL